MMPKRSVCALAHADNRIRRITVGVEQRECEMRRGAGWGELDLVVVRKRRRQMMSDREDKICSRIGNGMTSGCLGGDLFKVVGN